MRINTDKPSVVLMLVLVLVTWGGCGFEAYLIHVNHRTQENIKVGLQKLNEADRQVKEATERLQKLMKALPLCAAPDHRSAI